MGNKPTMGIVAVPCAKQNMLATARSTAGKRSPAGGTCPRACTGTTLAWAPARPAGRPSPRVPPRSRSTRSARRAMAARRAGRPNMSSRPGFPGSHTGGGTGQRGRLPLRERREEHGHGRQRVVAPHVDVAPHLREKARHVQDLRGTPCGDLRNPPDRAAVCPPRVVLVQQPHVRRPHGHAAAARVVPHIFGEMPA